MSMQWALSGLRECFADHSWTVNNSMLPALPVRLDYVNTWSPIRLAGLFMSESNNVLFACLHLVASELLLCSVHAFIFPRFNDRIQETYSKCSDVNNYLMEYALSYTMILMYSILVTEIKKTHSIRMNYSSAIKSLVFLLLVVN